MKESSATDVQVFAAEIKVQKEGDASVSKGLNHVLDAMRDSQAMHVELCLAGRTWLMLREIGDVEDTIAELLENSIELREKWLDATGEKLLKSRDG